MARTARVVVTDDFNGTEIIALADYEPLRFMVDGSYYEIDVTPENRSEFFEMIYPWTSAATEVPAPRGAAARKFDGPKLAARPKRRDPVLVGAIRQWARANGFEVTTTLPIPYGDDYGG